MNHMAGKQLSTSACWRASSTMTWMIRRAYLAAIERANVLTTTVHREGGFGSQEKIEVHRKAETIVKWESPNMQKRLMFRSNILRDRLTFSTESTSAAGNEDVKEALSQKPERDDNDTKSKDYTQHSLSIEDVMEKALTQVVIQT